MTKPDQSQASPALKMSLAPEWRATATLVADIAGQYRLDLWSEWLTMNGSAAPNATPQLMATCYFQAGENQTLKFIPIATAIVVIAAVVLLVLRTRKKKIKEEYLKAQGSEEDDSAKQAQSRNDPNSSNYKQSANSGLVAD